MDEEEEIMLELLEAERESESTDERIPYEEALRELRAKISEAKRKQAEKSSK